MEQGGFREEPKFATPEAELSYLREQIATKEKMLTEQQEAVSREAVAAEELQAYREFKPHEVLTPTYALKPHQVEEIVLELSPELHDEQMSELLTVLQERGLRNALTVVERLNNPHLDDDFHRFLVAYLLAGRAVTDNPEKTPVARALKLVLYEVVLPEPEEESNKRPLKELLSAMEQFYAGMLAATGASGLVTEPNYFTLEIANPNRSEEFIFYAGVPRARRELFEKQVLAIFPHAKLREAKDDYNVFNESGVSVGAEAVLGERAVFPLKTYDNFDFDPLNIILNSFSKIDREGEGAAIQFVVGPAEPEVAKDYKKALADLQKGKSVAEATRFYHGVSGVLSKGLDSLLWGDKDKKKEPGVPPKPVDETAVENLKAKLATPLLNCQIRVVASSVNREGALAILQDLESAFGQFEHSRGNKLSFRPKEKKELKRLLHDFSYRLYDPARALVLNQRELTTIMHWPQSAMRAASQLKQTRAASAPAPLGLPEQGILLGVNKNQNVETKIFMAREDRLRHFYTVGQTGTGKTTLLKNMIAQDIQSGDGVCMIDPHGSDIQDVLSIVPPERYEDVIYFDPAYTARPMGLNMLEYDARFPEQKTFVVNEMLSIFNKLFDMKVAGGPMFEQYFRNSVMLVLEDPTSGNTLLDVSRVLASKSFRDLKIANCKNPIVVQFWKEIAEKAGGESSLANIVPYITSKFDVFLQNDIMRPVVAQEKSSFNFREIMDQKKILLVNLSKGRLGDINANLIGLILVGKILMAALSRVDSLGTELPPFYLYIDEFQNITTDSISTILSEARKYKLSINIAHQFIKQLDEKIKDSVFGNVGSMAIFRVGSEDAEFLEKQLAPVFTARDIMNIDNFNAYLKLLAGGKPAKPFNIECLPSPKGDQAVVDKLKELSYLKFGRRREEVEAEVLAKYKKTP